MNQVTDSPDRARYLQLVLIAGFVTAADQFTKYLILSSMPLHGSFPVIPFFSITHIHNPGGAFGMFAGQSLLVRRLVFLALSPAMAGAILWFYHRVPLKFRWLSAALCLIFGGALDNLIARFRFGVVVDFIDT